MFVESFSVADRAWELTTNAVELLGAAREAFPDGRGRSAVAPDLRVRIRATDADGSGPWRRPVCRGRDHLAFCCVGEGSAIVFDYRRRSVTGSVTRSVAANAEYWREVVFPFALGVMSPVLGAVPLHATCIRYRNAGVLIGARSGAGKSTLAATFARRGIEFISDDWVYLTATLGLQAHALPVPLKLLPDARGFFPELRSMVPAESQNGEWSIAFDPARIFGSPRGRCCEPAVVILFDRIPGAELRVHRARTEDILHWFSEPLDCVPACLELQRQEQIALISALRSCRCYVVTCDGTPDEIADNLLRICDGAVPVIEHTCSARAPGVEHLDLLRRGVPATHARIADLGGTAAQIKTNRFEVLDHFSPVAVERAAFEVTVIVEPEPWPGSAKACAYQHDALGYISLGRDGLIAFDAEQCEAAAFVSEDAVRTGRVYHELRRMCGSFVRATAAST